MALMEKAEAFAVKAALEYLDRNPEKNLPKLMDWFDKFDRKGTLEKERGGYPEHTGGYGKQLVSVCDEPVAGY